MGYVDDATIAAFRGNFNLGIFFRLGTDPALRLAFGVNDVPIVIPSLDPPGTVYRGCGALLGIPDLETLINSLADTVSFTLDGLDPQAVAFMFDSAPEVLGASVTVGIAPLDARWQPLSPIVPLWTGTADFVAEDLKVETDPTKPQTQSITLTASTGDQSRQFQNLLTYSDLTQKTLHPGDQFCSRTVRYTQTSLVTWPRF